MRNATKAEDLIEIRDKLSEIIVAGIPVVTWQLNEGKRTILPVFIKEMIQDDQLLLQTATKGNFKFLPSIIYFYIASKAIIFKTTLDTMEDKFARVKFPFEVKFLDDSEVSNLEDDVGLKEFKKMIKGHGLGNEMVELMMVSGKGRGNSGKDFTRVSGSGPANTTDDKHMRLNTLNATEKMSTKWAVSKMSSHDADIFNDELNFISLDEEDKIYADQRETVRAKPKEGKKIYIVPEDGSSEEKVYSLYDLSQGGLSFISESETEFEKSQILHILAFDDRRFDTPMVAIVRAIREADETGAQFKIGCQFTGDEE